ncbi:toll/interleukin-1 receptor domain-containing protein [Mucilaginibacter sp.]|uniref:toll/interleukin-1 receptor domain-containing protein n=1 Tax=Mucilaginibacter sp. TaxID=1882438 RepID=UPI0026314A0D|nr:toll/interleukin-1 receptor domain-containing protein [Mucilaginibacter sp.]MDB4922910.1 hypothetical protein [Mucilaginibacter sp.]
MAYRHDIFVSYKWGGDLKVWVDSVFIPILKNVLIELKDEFRDTDIFHDVRSTLSGANVPDVLRDGVAYSKCMVCVVNKPYFTNSKWCTEELSAMLRREEETGVRRNADHVGLVFPVLFVDEAETELGNQNTVYTHRGAAGLLEQILPLKLNEEKFFCIAAGFKGTTGYDQLRLTIKRWVRNGLLKQIQTPPEWRPGWGELPYFESRFNPPALVQEHFAMPQL